MRRGGRRRGMLLRVVGIDAEMGGEVAVRVLAEL
jgi:hypothetical protein